MNYLLGLAALLAVALVCACVALAGCSPHGSEPLDLGAQPITLGSSAAPYVESSSEAGKLTIAGEPPK